MWSNRNVHAQSVSSARSFVLINCGANSVDLLESELSGHKTGNLAGATSPCQGRFELAEGGVLFLDKIDDMPTAV